MNPNIVVELRLVRLTTFGDDSWLLTELPETEPEQVEVAHSGGTGCNDDDVNVVATQSGDVVEADANVGDNNDNDDHDNTENWKGRMDESNG